MNTLKHWFAGIRVYIAIAIVLVTFEVWWWASASYAGSDLAAIRIQQAYAWIAMALLAMALLIGPLLKVLTRLPFGAKMLLRDARRMLGIGAAWFGLLHAGISYVALFGAPNPLTLADVYQRSFLLGMAALIILLLMAFTSFDRAFVRMGKWWFRLHRLVYVVVIMAVLHAFMVGTHAIGLGVLITVGVTAGVLLGLHIYIILRDGRPTKLQVITISYAVLFTLALLNYGVSQRLGYNLLLKSHERETQASHEK